jgi:hypothetical protein
MRMQEPDPQVAHAGRPLPALAVCGGARFGDSRCAMRGSSSLGRGVAQPRSRPRTISRCGLFIFFFLIDLRRRAQNHLGKSD